MRSTNAASTGVAIMMRTRGVLALVSTLDVLARGPFVPRRAKLGNGQELGHAPRLEEEDARHVAHRDAVRGPGEHLDAVALRDRPRLDDAQIRAGAPRVREALE